MGVTELRFGEIAAGRPYHAALVPVSSGRDGVTARHRHRDFLELMYVLSGSGGHRVGAVTQPLVAGHLVLVRPSDTHELFGTGTGMRLINVAFPVATWHSFVGVAQLTAAPAWERADAPPATLVGPGVQEPLADAFDAALRGYVDGPDPLHLVRLLAVALAHLGPGGDGASPEPAVPTWLARALRSMQEEQALRRGLPALLDAAAVSHGHLVRSMRLHCDRTPTEWLTDLRLRHAARWLVTTEDSVAAVAERCGFDSHSYFSRRFRDRFGMSPRDYRAQSHSSVVPRSGPR
jgi:AraC family transcriptional regulator, dual regulator of chb operon